MVEVKPALVEDELQLYVAPGLFVTERFTVNPGHTGFGLATNPTGVAGAFGSVKVTGPAYGFDEHPDALVKTKFV